MNIKRLLTTAIILAILGTLLYLQVRTWQKFDWHKLWVLRPSLAPLLLAVLLIYLTYLLRALRWKIFLRPVCKARVSRLIAPTFIGFTGLALLGRPGEFVRPYLIARKENVTVWSQIAVWTVERIFDIGAFTVLMAIDVFTPSSIQQLPYIAQFRKAAWLLIGIVAGLSLFAYMMKRHGPSIATWLHRVFVRVSPNLARHLDQKVRAFGDGMHTIQDTSALLQLIGVSLAIWFIIALSYRQIMHAYPVEMAPGVASSLNHMDVSHVLLLMGFSMVGSLIQLPAVGGGSQLAVIGALQAVFHVPPELAVSCGIVLWLITFVAVVPVGLALARHEHVSLRRISAQSHAVEAAAPQAQPVN